MKILLIQSYLGADNSEPVVFPIGLAYIGTPLLKKHEVQFWDPNISQNYTKDLSLIFEKFNPDVVGVSFRNVDSIFSSKSQSYYVPFVSLIRNIKEKAPYCKLVVGGAAFSIFPRKIMENNKEIDFGIVSEGEYAFSELVENFNHPERVKNLVFRKNGKIVFTERAEPLDFDQLPTPSRHNFMLWKYKDEPVAMGIQSKRGCGFGCVYCLHRFTMGCEYRLRSPKKVVDEIEELATLHDIKNFYFADPVFNFPLNHSIEICSEIIKRRLDINWEAAYRPDFVNERYMKLAIKAGCSLFDFSPDGASDNALRVLGKNLTVAHIENTIDLVRKLENACVGYDFVYDLPSYNSEHILGLFRLFPKILTLPRNKLRYLTLTKMRIFPNTPLYEIALKEGKITKDTDLIYPIHYDSASSDILPKLLGGSAFLFQRITDRCQAFRNKT